MSKPTDLNGLALLEQSESIHCHEQSESIHCHEQSESIHCHEQSESTLAKLVEKNPHRDWDYSFFQAQVNTKYIEKHPEFSWDFSTLFSVHNDLSIEFIERYICKPWNFKDLSLKVSIEFIDRHNDKSWDWNLISIRQLPFWFIEKYLSNIPDINKILIPNFDFTFLDRHRDVPFNGDNLSKNKMLTLEIIDRFPNISWNWETITVNFALRDSEYSILLNNPERSWNFTRICKRYKIPFDILKTFKEKLDWDNISLYRISTLEEIESTIESLPWNFNNLSKNLELYGIRK